MAALDEITKGYQALSANYVDEAGAIAGNTFRNLGKWRDEDIATFVEQVSVPLQGIKRNAASSAIAYHEQVAKISKRVFKAPSLSDLDLSMSALRNGANVNQVYGRPFVQMRMALAKGESFTDALDLGSRTATSFARTEVQLSRRQASLFARKANDNIVGFLRTLSGSENCALCYVASTQRYRKGDLLPIHPACDCGEMPIYGDTDTGQIIDQQLLDQSHEAVGQRFGIDVGGREPDYRKIMIRDHGEMGPMLTVRGQKFTGPNSLDLVGKKMPVKTPAQKSTDALQTAKNQIREIPAGNVIASNAINNYRNKTNVGTVKVSRIRNKKNTDFVDEQVSLPDDKTNANLDKILAVGKTADDEIGRRTSAALASKNLGNVSDSKKRYEAKRAEHRDALAAESAYTKKLEAEFDAKMAEKYGRPIDPSRFDDFARESNKFYSDLNDNPQRLALEKKANKLRDEALAIQDDYLKSKYIIETTRIEETKRFISETRSVGEGAQPTFMSGGQAAPHIKYAFDQYPTDWVNKASSEIPRVQPRKVDRGWHVVRKDSQGKFSEIRVSGNTRKAPSPTVDATRTAIHEVGHYMETTVPGLREMEWAYYHRRANGEYLQADLGYDASKEFIVDAWRESYSGKAYSGLLADPVSRNYEIFTTGIESVLGTSNYFAGATKRLPDGKRLDLGEDVEFRQFVLGVLLGL